MQIRFVIAVSWLMFTAGTLRAQDGEHVLVFAPDMPVVVRLDVEFEPGVMLADNRRQYADRWFKRLDHDASGTIEPAEAVHVPSFGRFEEIAGEMQQEWTRLDTMPADGRLSADELLEHIEAAMGSRLTIKRSRRSATQTVILHPRLDRDGDAQVSVDEVLAGLTSLRPFDFDDDQSLSAAELQPFPRSMRTAQIINTGQTPFVALDETADIEDIARRLIAQYAQAEGDSEPIGLSVEALGIDAERFAALDVEADGRLTSDELQKYLADPQAQLQVRLQFPRGRRVKRIEGQAVGHTDAVVVRDGSTRKKLLSELGGLNVEAELLDAGGSGINIAQLVRGRDFTDADKDRDGMLNRLEFSESRIDDITFAAADADRNELVSREEFEAFLDLRALLNECLLEMTVTDETTSLFEALDDDEDYRLSPREFEQGAASLIALDSNGNGKLAESELVTRYMLRFAIVQPPQFVDLVETSGFTGMTDETQLPIVRPVTSGPEWFRRMDRNQDGDVTWREFLGPRDAFERLDADGNGLIDSDEAAGTAAE